MVRLAQSASGQGSQPNNERLRCKDDTEWFDGVTVTGFSPEHQSDDQAVHNRQVNNPSGVIGPQEAHQGGYDRDQEKDQHRTPGRERAPSINRGSAGLKEGSPRANQLGPGQWQPSVRVISQPLDREALGHLVPLELVV